MNTPPTPPAPPNPWYREPWPWLLMSGPAIVVVAGFITLYLAVSGADGLVVDDYYKQGKSINQTLHRDDVARQAELRASVTFDQVADHVEVTLKSADGNLLKAPLTLSLIHATRSGFDVVIALKSNGNHYVGQLPTLLVGKWNLLLEDQPKRWRLQHEINVGSGAIPRIDLLPPTAGVAPVTTP